MKLLHLTELFFNDFIFYSVKKQFEYLKMMLQRKIFHLLQIVIYRSILKICEVARLTSEE